VGADKTRDSKMDLGLKGRAALVTGAARGIGKAEALALAAEGCAVAVNDIDRAAADATVAELRGRGVTAVACIGDVSDEAGAETVVRAAHDGLGRIDILVNNAGAGGRHLGRPARRCRSTTGTSSCARTCAAPSCAASSRCR